MQRAEQQQLAQLFATCIVIRELVAIAMPKHLPDLTQTNAAEALAFLRLCPNRLTVRAHLLQEAQKELTRLLAAADRGTLPDPSSSTLAEYLRAWLDGALGLSPKTLERYRELAERQIIPHLGATKLQRLKPEHMQQWHGTLLTGGLSARTVGHAHRVLRLVLQCAAKNGTVARNVATIHAPPKVEETEIEILSADQIADALFDGHTLFPIVALALATGMRRGELLGLQWGDVDLDGGTLRVERRWRKLKLACASSRQRPSGVAAISLCRLRRPTVVMLRTHKVQQMELRFIIGAGAIRTDTLVFGTVDGGLMRPRNLSKAWWRARSAMKLPAVSFHAFRHSHASMLIRAGVDVITVSRRLGHANASITLTSMGI